jgi:Rod binding domain-containing protein
MDGIEPIGMPPILPPLEQVTDLPSALVRPRQPAAPRHDVQGTDGGISPAARGDEQKKRIARDFESVLLGKLFDQVQESTGGWGLEEEDGAAPQVQGLFWMHLARDVADKGGLGLWKDIYQYLRQMEGTGAAGDAINEEL